MKGRLSRCTHFVGMALGIVFSTVVASQVQAQLEVLADYRFEGNGNDSSGFGFHGELVGDAAIVDGRLALPGGLDNGMAIDLGEFNPFGGQANFSIEFDFQTQDGSTGALFSSDGSPPEEPWPADQVGSFNVFLGEGGAVVTDFWFIDAVESLDFYNDDETHRYFGSYDAETGEYTQIINEDDEAFHVFLTDEGEPIDRNSTADRTLVGDESNPDFGFEFNPDGFQGFFDNLVIKTDGQLPEKSLPGDFDGSLVLDLPDVNLLSNEIKQMTNNAEFDLNDDMVVDAADLNIWVKDLKKTWFGDADLNGEFNTTDLVLIFQAGKFEVDSDAGWEEGDWSGDVRFSTADLVNAFQDGGFETGPVAAAVVPEPTSWLLILSSVLLVGRLRRQPPTVRH